ncbi:MAG: ATP-binding cassette domain-containing protein [Hadesarchaea archaeon]|nr:ATP-binding cassette domain-containing protein [Hadesarchaea archaeon]MDH5685946.1 ATP-binding cassette domain-containing protein [Hadesarchaea archaeon]
MRAIFTNGLTREFNGLTAVDHVNLQIEKGELFGLLGPNGAGKTTLIHMLCTILPPTEGTAKVAGFDVYKEPDSVRTSIGIVFQDPSLDNRLTGKENLDFHGRVYGMSKTLREKRIDEVLKLVELEDRANALVETYSSGMRRRLEIARSFMHHPEIMFLDEPTLGLDPQTRRKIWEHVQMLNKQEKITILLTTHYMDEADYLCGRVGIIDHGRIIALDNPKKLKDQLEGDIVSLEVPLPKKYAEIFRRRKYVKEVKIVGDYLYLTVTGSEKVVPKLIDIVARRGGKVRSVGCRSPTLEDVFIRYTGRGIREEEGGIKEQMRAHVRAHMR